MSHTVEIKTEVRDEAAVRAACDRLRLPPPVQGTFKLFNSEAMGLGVELREWRYPIVCDTANGQVSFDNFGGRWGNQARLDEFLQMYAVEKTRIEARKKGHTVTEQSLADGSIKLTVNVGGVA